MIRIAAGGTSPQSWEVSWEGSREGSWGPPSERPRPTGARRAGYPPGMGPDPIRGAARAVATSLLVVAGAVGPALAGPQRGEGPVRGERPVPGAGTLPGDGTGAARPSEVASRPADSAERWRSGLVLGIADALDLEAAAVVAASEPLEGPAVLLVPAKVSVTNPLQGTAPLRLDGDVEIVRLAPRADGGPAHAVALADTPAAPGGAAATEPLEVGQEFVVRATDSDLWSYLRVEDVAVDRVVLEVASAPMSTATLVRAPGDLRVAEERGGFRLRWDGGSGEPTARFRVRRSTAGPAAEPGEKGAGATAADWETLALVSGSDYRDDEAPWGRVVRYEVALVGEGGSLLPGHLGARLSAVRTDTPGEWSFGVRSADRVDLVSGRTVGPDDVAHIEVHSGPTGQFALKPLEGVRFALDQKVAAAGGNRRWWLPPGSDRRFVPGRTAMVASGGELEFQLPGGTLGRLHLEGGSGTGGRLKRHLALDGDRLLPRPPGAAPEVERTGDHGVALLFGPLDRRSGVEAVRVQLVVEKEIAYGQGDWTVLTEAAPGERRVELPTLFLDRPEPIARLRFRQRVRGGGLSHPSLPLDVVADGRKGERREALLGAALAAIDDADFQRRLEARGVLVALADLARDPLVALVAEEDGPRALAAQAILEAIESDEGGGRGLARRTRRRALELAREAPRLGALSEEARAELLDAHRPDLRHEDPAERLHALLRLVDRAERGVLRPASAPGDLRDDCEVALVWAKAVAQSEPDPGARQLAAFAADLGVVPSMASFESERPAFLPDGAPPDGGAPLPGASWTELPGAAEELVWQLERRPELGDLDFGPPLAQLLGVLRSGARARTANPATDPAAGSVAGSTAGPPKIPVGGEDDARLFDYDARDAELVLRLLERARTAARPEALLAAASQIAGGPERRLLAQREVSDRRLASPSDPAGRRRSILLESPSLDLLEAAILEETDRQAGAPAGAPVEGLDLLLPAGVYEDPSGAPGRTIEVLASGIRLMPSGAGEQVELRTALRIRGARDVVLQDLTLESDSTTALNVLEMGHAVVLECAISGAGTVVFLQDGDLELVGSRVDPAGDGRNPQWAVRELGRCRLFVRASLLRAGSIYASDESENWLDRSVLDAGSRTLLQAPRAGHLMARESLLKGTNLGLYNVDRGVLAGVVIDVPRDPLGRRPGGLRVGPRYFHLVGEGQVVPTSMRLENELLRPR